MATVAGLLIATAAAADPLDLVPQPDWFTPSLRATPSGSAGSAELVIPSVAGADGLVGGGVFLTLPVSPVYAGEAFDVFIFADTSSNVLSSLTVCRVVRGGVEWCV